MDHSHSGPRVPGYFTPSSSAPPGDHEGSAFPSTRAPAPGSGSLCRINPPRQSLRRSGREAGKGSRLSSGSSAAPLGPPATPAQAPRRESRGRSPRACALGAPRRPLGLPVWELYLGGWRARVGVGLRVGERPGGKDARGLRGSSRGRHSQGWAGGRPQGALAGSEASGGTARRLWVTRPEGAETKEARIPQPPLLELRARRPRTGSTWSLWPTPELVLRKPVTTAPRTLSNAV